MRDRGWILGAFAVVLVLVTWPAWRAVASAPPRRPDLPRPAGATACVAPVEFMRASHMTLLVQWRDRVVRDGVRTYVDSDGRVVTMSLSGTCIGACHTDKTKFCDRCHDYAGVTPTCWNCHVVPPAVTVAGGVR
ncbi:MAG: sulfate reduction electron transfer complex DsrMKJOP subunit DsrJ [Acidobacteria bacterium]|nr:sulfate reduction electron transfer complex DsrMKJOP subunit DsrJ [Acidobacteriota bacterium]